MHQMRGASHWNYKRFPISLSDLVHPHNRLKSVLWQRNKYRGTSVFDHLPNRTIRFLTKKFELKMLLNSNRTLVFEHSGREPKRAEWGRSALSARSRGNKKSRVEPKRTRQTGFLLKRRGRLLPCQIHLQRRERERKKKPEGELPSLV